MELLPFICCGVIFLIAMYTDARHQRIPNMLTVPAAIGGISYHIFLNGLSVGFFFSFKGLLLGLGILFIPFVLGGMGGGDVKLLGAVGCWLGAAGVFNLFLYGALIGGVMAVTLMIKIGGFSRVGYFFMDILWFFLIRKPVEMHKDRDGFPYALPLAGGYAAYLVLGPII